MSFLYVNFIFILFIIFFIFNKKSRLKLFDVTIVLGTLYYLFFQYNDIKKILHNIFNLFERGKLTHFLKDIDGQISFTIIIIISLTLIYFIYKKKNNLINLFLTFFFLLNLIVEVNRITSIENIIEIEKNKNFSYENLKIDSNNKNNIYFFILDAMPPIQLADTILKTDSRQFLNDLDLLDYVYLPETNGLYGNTFLSIGSIFNMNPIEINEYGESKISNLEFPIILRKKNLSNLEFNLNKLNYEIKWIGSHFANCHGYNVEYCIQGAESENILFNYEILTFLQKTPVQPIIHIVLKILNLLSSAYKHLIFLT